MYAHSGPIVLIALLISLTKSIKKVNCAGAVPQIEDCVVQYAVSSVWAKEKLLTQVITTHIRIYGAIILFIQNK